MSFDKLMYKGKEVKINLKQMQAGIIYVDHLYSLNWKDDKKEHSCLRFGKWCWRDAIEHPLDALKYLQYRMTNNA